MTDEHTQETDEVYGEATPDWWPRNPYFPSIFTMSIDDVIQALPDELVRTGVAGKLMHDAWELASQAILQAVENHGFALGQCLECCPQYHMPNHTIFDGQCIRQWGHTENHLAMHDGGCSWER